MKLCKPLWSKHIWKRYSEEKIQQIGFENCMTWYQCQKCLKIKWDWWDGQEQIVEWINPAPRNVVGSEE